MMLAMIAGTSTVFAEDTVSPEAKTLREQMRDKKNVAVDATARTKELRDKMQKMGSSLLRHEMVQRAVFGFAQMQNIEKRMEHRIAKLEAAGVDVSTLDTKVAAVKTALDTAKAKLEALKEAVAGLPDTTTKEQKAANNTTIMPLKKDAEAAVKNVRIALEDLLKSLKTYKMPEQAKTGENN